MKEVLDIIVSLLKDRICAEEEPDRKKARIKGYHLKKIIVYISIVIIYHRQSSEHCIYFSHVLIKNFLSKSC